MKEKTSDPDQAGSDDQRLATPDKTGGALDLQPSTPGPPQVPDHEMLRCIGGGSYGEVWLAHNVVGTWRAVKVVRRATFERAEHFEREFRGIQKFEPISRSHEGFVDILQIGRNDEAGYFYYVMELADDATAPVVRRLTSNTGLRVSPPSAASKVQGAPENSSRSIDSASAAAGDSRAPQSELPHVVCYQPRTLRSEQQRHGRLPVPDCVNIGITLTSALAHLHKHGLVHRDVKPSNIIFVGGVPKLADIGLVADASEARSFVGTVGFIPPEGPGSPQANLYSLGKVLYEISTGQDRQDFPQLPPDLLRGSANAERETRSAESLSRSTPRSALRVPHSSPLIELNEVLLKACHKDVRQRYASADAMLADLQLLQRGQSVQHKRVMEVRIRIAKKFCLTAGVIALATFLGHFVLRQAETKQRAGVLKPQQGLSAGTTNQEAFNACQLGQFFFNKLTRDGVLKAINHFSRAIQLDTNFVAAYAGLADCYIWNPPAGYNEALPKIHALANQLLKLDDSRPEGHTALAMHLWWAERKPLVAAREFQRAIALDENYAPASHYHGILLTSLGRFDEAHAFLKRAVLLQPTSVNFRIALGFPYLAAGDFGQAIAAFERARELEAETASAHKWLALAYEGKGDFLKALSHFEKGELLFGHDAGGVQRRYDLARQAIREAGAPGYWQARLAIALEPKYPVLLWGAAACARLGDKKRALDLLEQAATEAPADVGILRLLFVSGWDPLRSDGRFIAFLKKTGLEE